MPSWRAFLIAVMPRTTPITPQTPVSIAIVSSPRMFTAASTTVSNAVKDSLNISVFHLPLFVLCGLVFVVFMFYEC